VLSDTPFQRTLTTAIDCRGTGVHSGRRVTMTLHPAPADTGIVFVRRDVDPACATVQARWDQVRDTRLCTVLGNEAGTTVGTVEHLMAAFAAASIDNAVVELDGPEVPIMDGSAAPFVFLIDCAGICEQDAPRRAICVLKCVEVQDDTGARVALHPAARFSAHMHIAFTSKAIRRQSFAFDGDVDSFRHAVAPARTFGFLQEVEQLRAAGLAQGGSLSNAIVIDGDRIMNEDGLRFADEFARHKLLDAIGDLYLAGAPMIGRFEGARSGHRLNNALLRTLLADRDAWAWSDSLTLYAAEGQAALARTA
jgi:UDP-3-O-[3-hydroxymyristoyl] N-acetylglucosamine deacetylase